MYWDYGFTTTSSNVFANTWARPLSFTFSNFDVDLGQAEAPTFMGNGFQGTFRDIFVAPKDEELVVDKDEFKKFLGELDE